MRTDTKELFKLRLFGLLAVIIFIVELILCFNGPFAFVHKPTLILFAPLDERISPDEETALIEFLEQQIALSNSYTIVDHRSVEEHIIRTDPDQISEQIGPANVDEAQQLAQNMELERFGIITVWPQSYKFHFSLYIRDARDQRVLKSGSFSSSSLEELLSGFDADGESLNIQEQMINVSKGIGFTDYMVLFLLGIQLVIGLTALFGKEPGLSVEFLLAPAVILFLFAFIHALSANMDYVQRYIASGGQLRMAKNTALAQLYAFLRFGPILILNGFYYMNSKLKIVKLRSLLKPTNWLKRWIEPWSFLWVLLSALLFSLSFPSFLTLEGISVLAWFCLVPLFLVLLTSPYPVAVFYGVIFGTVQTLIISYWLGTYKYVTLHMATIAQLGQYLLFMIPFLLIIKLSRRWGFLTVPAAWTVFDFLRSIGILGFPWGLIGTSQYRFLPLIQIASLSGVWGIGFIVLLFNASLAWSLAAPSMGWTWPSLRVHHRLSASFPVIIATAVLLISLCTGSLLLHNLRGRLDDAPDHATILLLQQNTDPRKREYKENTEKLKELTDQALSGMSERPDLIVWPEGGFRLDLRYWMQEKKQESRWGKVAQDFLTYQRNLETWLVSGTQDHEEIELEFNVIKKTNYNSSVFLDNKGNIVDFYHKMHLVPFSEYFPLDKQKFSWLNEMFSKYNISNWGVGNERKVIQHQKMRFFTPICFEDVFSDHVRRYVLNDVDVIINMSNDYWSLSPVEGRQHGIFSLFRAVENQRPILRSSSSGYTVYIDATGKIQPGSPDAYTEGWVVADVALPEKKLTLYTRWGDWFPKICLGGLLASLFGLVIYIIHQKIRTLLSRKRFISVTFETNEMQLIRKI
jgi:apolipoprotein N-acyltransferase